MFTSGYTIAIYPTITTYLSVTIGSPVVVIGHSVVNKLHGK